MAKGRKCVRCGRDPDRSRRYAVAPDQARPRCPRCFFRRLARRHAGSGSLWTELQRLFDAQRGRCWYTGEPLVLGLNASLDHRRPKSKGGTGRPDNLQWVTTQVNDFKRDLGHTEFVALCRKVTECCGQRPDKS